MVIAVDFPMFDTTNPKLLKSADALESALAQLGKNSSTGVDKSASDLFASANAGNGFDEWLAADLSLSLSGDDSSITSSPFSPLEDSPVLGFDSFGSVVDPSLFELPLNVSSLPVANELPASPVEIKASAPAASAAKVPSLTSAAIHQAAAALNIPWSPALESAVMAQAALSAAIASIPSPVTSPILAPKAEPVEEGSAPSIPSSPVLAPAVAAAAAPSHTPVTRGKGSKKRQLTAEEEAEEIVAKRAKNTDAARRSRLKKLIKLEGLEAKVSDLEAANNALNMKIAILETEKNGFMAKDAEQTARIAQLEAQLAEVHAALTNRATASA